MTYQQINYLYYKYNYISTTVIINTMTYQQINYLYYKYNDISTN